MNSDTTLLPEYSLSLIHIYTILGWADTEGYPVDGTVDADGQYSKADIPEHTQYDTQSLAKFAFSMFWRAMRFAEEQQVPILLDY